MCQLGPKTFASICSFYVRTFLKSYRFGKTCESVNDDRTIHVDYLFKDKNIVLAVGVGGNIGVVITEIMKWTV